MSGFREIDEELARVGMRGIHVKSSQFRFMNAMYKTRVVPTVEAYMEAERCADGAIAAFYGCRPMDIRALLRACQGMDLWG